MPISRGREPAPRIHNPPPCTGCPGAPSSFPGPPPRRFTERPQPAGAAGQVEGEKPASPGMIPSSGGRMVEIKLFDLREPQEDIRVEPDSTPMTRKKSLRFIRRSLYLWQGGQSRGAPPARGQDTHPPISREPTLRVFFIAPPLPWRLLQS